LIYLFTYLDLYYYYEQYYYCNQLINFTHINILFNYFYMVIHIIGNYILINNLLNNIFEEIVYSDNLCFKLIEYSD